jgi:hypothetical protein
MKTVEHLMHSVICGVCFGTGPMAHTQDGAKTLARALGWATERGVTRCNRCREERKR